MAGSLGPKSLDASRLLCQWTWSGLVFLFWHSHWEVSKQLLGNHESDQRQFIGVNSEATKANTTVHASLKRTRERFKLSAHTCRVSRTFVTHF